MCGAVEAAQDGQNRYDVLLVDVTIGRVWNRHGSWAAQVGGKMVLVNGGLSFVKAQLTHS